MLTAGKQQISSKGCTMDLYLDLSNYPIEIACQIAPKTCCGGLQSTELCSLVTTHYITPVFMDT